MIDQERLTMNIVLINVEDVATVMLLKLFRRNGIIRHLAVDGLVLVALIGDDLEEGAASTAGLSENDCGRL